MAQTETAHTPGEDGPLQAQQTHDPDSVQWKDVRNVEYTADLAGLVPPSPRAPRGEEASHHPHLEPATSTQEASLHAQSFHPKKGVGVERGNQAGSELTSGVIRESFLDSTEVRRGALAALAVGAAAFFGAFALKGTTLASTFPFLTQNYGDFLWPALLAQFPWQFMLGLGDSESPSPLLRFIKNRAAEVSVVAGFSYVALSETLLPQLVPMGCPDIYDVPAAALGALLAYVGYFRPVNNEAVEADTAPLVTLVGMKLREGVTKLKSALTKAD